MDEPGSRGWKVTVAALSVAAASLLPASAGAGPSVWTQAREPDVAREQELAREAQRSVLKYRRLVQATGSAASSLAEVLLRDARRSLEQLVKAGTRDFGVRLLYVEVLRESKAGDDALEVVKKLLADDPPTPIKADALAELALLHAHAGRREDEIRAYTDALEIEPHAAERSRLLSNRAESLMALGDVTAAVEGYREALAPLTTFEMFQVGSTTLFGLGVALDRLGNLEDGLQSVKLARSYDPSDKRLRRDSWFFSPEWDEHWYWALGAWSCARFSESLAARAECYLRAIQSWDDYIKAAPADDRWVPLAQVRLAAVTREHEAFEQRMKSRRAASATPGKPSRPAEKKE